MESDYQILHLTELFYHDYPNPPYRELMAKQGRPYNCLLFQSHYDYFVCIPYRSEINHSNAFLFQGSKRSRQHRSGLDYSKIIIISDTDYIGSDPIIIDHDEYRETVSNLDTIKQQALDYVEDYVSIHRGLLSLAPKDFRKKYYYSTLKYFHKELGIPLTFSSNPSVTVPI